MLDDRSTVPDLDITLPPQPQSVREARHRIEALTALCPERARTTAALLTSELASNAVLHARTPFTVRAAVDGVVIRVSVSDVGRGRPTLQAGGPTPMGGWGLTMVDHASSRWGIREESGCTTVWFELDAYAES